MSHGQPPWEKASWALIAAVIGMELLADVLPRLLAPIIVVAVLAIVIRMVWWYTRL